MAQPAYATLPGESEGSTFRSLPSAARPGALIELVRASAPVARATWPVPPVKRPSRLSTRRLAKHLEDVVLLKAVVKAGSINKAALELSISQPALSRRIERLEDSFGFPILRRSQNGVRFEAGVESIDTYLDQIEQAIDAMAGWVEAQGLRSATSAGAPAADLS